MIDFIEVDRRLIAAPLGSVLQYTSSDHQWMTYYIKEKDHKWKCITAPEMTYTSRAMAWLYEINGATFGCDADTWRGKFHPRFDLLNVRYFGD